MSDDTKRWPFGEPLREPSQRPTIVMDRGTGRAVKPGDDVAPVASVDGSRAFHCGVVRFADPDGRLYVQYGDGELLMRYRPDELVRLDRCGGGNECRPAIADPDLCAEWEELGRILAERGNAYGEAGLEDPLDVFPSGVDTAQKQRFTVLNLKLARLRSAYERGKDATDSLRDIAGYVLLELAAMRKERRG